MSSSVRIYIDGASRGNPGPAGIGIILNDSINKISLYKYIGETTNNVAEYVALIYAVQEALIQKRDSIVINSDSELLVRQLKGDYKVKNENLKAYFEQFRHLSKGFSQIEINLISRQENSLADKLANKAIDSRISTDLKTE